LKVIEEPNSGRGIPVICAGVYVAKAIVIAGVMIALAIRGRSQRLLGDDLTEPVRKPTPKIDVAKYMRAQEEEHEAKDDN
jgi:hypothetical protein